MQALRRVSIAVRFYLLLVVLGLMMLIAMLFGSSQQIEQLELLIERITNRD